MLATGSSLIISEQIIEIDNPKIFKWADVLGLIFKKLLNIEKKNIIKVNLVKSTQSTLYFCLSYIEGLAGFIENPFFPNQVDEICDVVTDEISCLIIPTGVGASFGGYAGDANPIAKLLSYTNKYLLTHPNVVNAAVLTDLPKNLIYLEGFLLDQFLLGKINLLPTKKNKIGVIFDAGISEERLQYELNVLNATRAVYGCEIIGWTKTKKPLKVFPEVNEFRFSSGRISNLEYILDEAIKLKNIGVTAIAICAAMPDLPLNLEYVCGRGVDPIGGIESLISHTVSAVTGLVSAHAPVLYSEEKINYTNINPASAAEYIAQTFLPSVISGLRYAPSVLLPDVNSDKSVLSFKNISKILVPANAFGSAGVLSLNQISDKVLLVKENKTALDLSSEHINMPFNFINSYGDFIDEQTFEKEGIDLSVLKRPMERIKKL